MSWSIVNIILEVYDGYFFYIVLDLEINNLLYGIFNGGINITLMLSQVLSKLENLQTVFAEMNFNLPLTESFDAQFLEKFPINNPDALEHVEQCILNNNFDFGRKLVRHFYIYLEYIDL